MTSFQEFLKKKAEEHNGDSSRELRAEWIAAVERLCNQILAWLEEDDPEGYLRRARWMTARSEEGLGDYRASALTLSFGNPSFGQGGEGPMVYGQEVRILPIARKVVGMIRPPGGPERRADGLVEIARGGEKSRLYRVVKDGQETWYTVDEKFDATPFDKKRLEEILLDLFS